MTFVGERPLKSLFKCFYQICLHLFARNRQKVIFVSILNVILQFVVSWKTFFFLNIFMTHPALGGICKFQVHLRLS